MVRLPYVDFYETKPPGLFYIYALLELTFGKSVEALHAAGIVLNLLTTIVFLIGKALMDRSTGVISAASQTRLQSPRSADDIRRNGVLRNPRRRPFRAKTMLPHGLQGSRQGRLGRLKTERHPSRLPLPPRRKDRTRPNLW